MRYAAFLRAVNLGRNRRVTSAQLKSLFEEVGAEDVATFRTSGNVVFEASRDMVRELEQAPREGARPRDGDLPADGERGEGDRRARAVPGQGRGDVEGEAPGVAAGEEADRRDQKKALALATDQDRLTFGKRELYWLPSGGTMESELDRKALDELIGPTTMRTKGTVEQLAAKYFG